MPLSQTMAFPLDNILFLCIIICNYIFASPAHPSPYLRVQPNEDTICVFF